MSSLLDAMSAMANSDGFARRPGGLGTHPGSAKAAGSLWNIPGLQDAMVQRGIGRLPQQQVQQPARPMSIYEYWKLIGGGKPAVWGQPDPLDALRRANLPLMGL